MSENQSGCVGLHPATRIFLWVSLIICQSNLTGVPFYVCVAVLSVFLLTSSGVYSRRILWRSRFLLATLLFIYPWNTPGVYVFSGLAEWSPTYEGSLLAFDQLLHTGTVLVGLGWALGGLALNARLAAILLWLRPLHFCGLPIERFVVRLALTLQLLESAPRHTTWSGWQLAWQEVWLSSSESSPIREVIVEIAPLKSIDYGVIFLTICGVLLCVGL